jgi:hypothetical protein
MKSTLRDYRRQLLSFWLLSAGACATLSNADLLANLGPPTSKPRFGGAFFVGPEAHAGDARSAAATSEMVSD